MQKSILITGSTDGIGKLAALQLAQAGHQVYLHGRNATKLEAVIQEIKAKSNNEQVKGFVADFSDLKAVKNMASEVSEAVPQLDVLINNAGVYKSAKNTSQDGLDMRFVVNYFAPYLLTNALLQNLKKASAPRLINLSSAAQAPVSLKALLGQAPISTPAAYAQSKLALSMWSSHLAAKETDLVVIAVNPGSLLNTRMVKEGFGFHRAPAEKGGNILYDLAINEKYHAATGKYFDNDIGTFGSIHPAGIDKAAIQNLIEASNDFLGF